MKPELDARIEQDCYVFADKVVGVTYAQIGGTAVFREDLFPKEKPLLVRISGGWDHVDDRGDIHTHYCAEALPGQLKAGETVSWIDGPIYHKDGRMELPQSWTGAPYDEEDLSETQA